MKTALIALTAASMAIQPVPAEARHSDNGRHYSEYDRYGRYYEPRRITRRDYIWRGRDGRYYCRRSNGTTGPALIRQYYFGPTEAVSGVGYDPGVSRYMVTTSDAGSGDGRLYYIDVISDPTPSSP